MTRDEGKEAPVSAPLTLEPETCPSWLRPLVDNVGQIPEAYRHRLPAGVLAMVTAAKAASSMASLLGDGRDAAVLVLISGPESGPADGRVPRRRIRSQRRRSGGHRAARSAGRNRDRPQSAASAGHHGADVHRAVAVPRRPGAGVLAGSRPGGRHRRDRNGDRVAGSVARLHQSGEPAHGVPRQPRPPLGRPRVPVEPDARVGIHWPGDICGARRRRLGATLGHHRHPRAGRGDGAGRRGGWVTMSSMNPSQWLDIAVLAVAFIAAISGWRSGALGSVLSFVGVLLGALAGVLLAPHIVSHIAAPRAKLFTALFLILALVVVGEVAGVVLGRAVRSAIRSSTIRLVDSIVGVGVQLIVVLTAAWLLATPLTQSKDQPELAAAVRGSRVLAKVNELAPPWLKTVPKRLSALLNTSGLPAVLEPFSRTPVIPVASPDPALANNPVVLATQPSVVKVRSLAPSCQKVLEGSGFVIAPNRVMTNAHVV